MFGLLKKKTDVEREQAAQAAGRNRHVYAHDHGLKVTN